MVREGPAWEEGRGEGRRKRRGEGSGGHGSATVATERPSNLDSKMTLTDALERNWPGQWPLGRTLRMEATLLEIRGHQIQQ